MPYPKPKILCCYLSALASIAGAGCADTDTPETSDPPVRVEPLDGCEAIKLDPPKPGAGVQVKIEMPLGPGEERQVCRLVLLEEAVNLNWSEGLYTRGSHHGLTARTSYRDALPTENIRGEPVADASQLATCESLNSDWDIFAVIAGGHAADSTPKASLHSKGTLPDDVALKIDANEVLAVNFHMINVTDKPIKACYKQNLYSIPDAQVKHEAGTMFYYNSFLTLPARSKTTSTMACPIQHDVMLADQVSHMHKRGVGYKAELLDGDPLMGGKAIDTLYETNTWDEPIVAINQPARTLQTGQWIRWSCDFQNPEDRNVAQGQQTTDEMCMFLGTYWPRSPEMDFCIAEGSQRGYSASRLLSNGTMNGAQFIDCWNNSPQKVGGGGPESADARYATQRCFTGSCPKVAGRINDFNTGKVDPNTVGCD